MRTLIAIDPSIANTGYAIYRDKQLITYGVIRTKADKKTHERLSHIGKQLRILCIEYKISVAIIEEPGYFVYSKRKNSAGYPIALKGFIMVNQAFAYIVTWLYDYGCEVNTVLAADWKGSGKNARSKSYDKILASQIAGILIRNSDIADAIVLGQWHLLTKCGMIIKH